jgi:hypothetical protein
LTSSHARRTFSQARPRIKRVRYNYYYYDTHTWEGP